MKSEFVYRLIRWLGLDITTPRGIFAYFLPILFFSFFIREPVSPLASVMLTVGYHVVYGLMIAFTLYIIRVDTGVDKIYGIGLDLLTKVLLVIWLISLFLTSAYAASVGIPILSLDWLFGIEFGLLLAAVFSAVIASSKREGSNFLIWFLLIVLFFYAIASF